MDISRGIVDPPIDALLEKAQSKYALVIYAAKRARQIDEYYIDLHEGSFYGHIGPLVEAGVDDKSLTIAMKEISEDKLILRPAS